MNFESKLNQLALRLTYYSLIILVIGIFTSTSLFGVHHFLLLFPILYFTPKSDRLWVSNSHLCLLILCVIIILSILVNWDILLDLKDSFGMGKYYIISALAIFPYREAFKNYIDFPRKKILLNLFLLCTTLASLSGLVAVPTGFNYLAWVPNAFPGRSSGIVGGLLGHSYGMGILLIILSGMLVNYNSLKKYVSKNFLLLCLLINFLNLYFSYSRGPLLGFILGLPFLFWFKSKRISVAILILGMAFLGLNIKFNKKSQDRFLNSHTSNDQRMVYFKTAILGFLERPILGWGMDNFKDYVIPIKKKYHLKYQDQPGKVHNNFTEFLSTTGILGFTFLTLFIFYWIKEVLNFGFFKETYFSFILSMLISGMFYNTLTEKSLILFILGTYNISYGLIYSTVKQEKNSLESGNRIPHIEVN